MRAVVFEGPSQLRFEPAQAEPEIDERHALIRVRFAGICGSDITHYLGKNPRAKLPVIPGHEILGRVEAYASAGPETARPPVGTRVAVLPTLSCGACDLCRSGRRHLCRSLQFIGVQTNGAMAELVAAPQENLYPVPDTLEDETAALCEPVAVALHAVRQIDLRPSETVLVLGAGPIGLLVAHLARFAACRVRIKEIVEHRARSAREMGFEVFPDEPDGGSADPAQMESRHIFECTGNPSAAATMVDLGEHGGNIVIVGAFKAPTDVDLFRLARKEVTVRGSFAYTASDFEDAIALLGDHGEELSRIVTHRFALEEAPAAFETMMSGRCIKALMEPAGISGAGPIHRPEYEDIR